LIDQTAHADPSCLQESHSVPWQMKRPYMKKLLPCILLILLLPGCSWDNEETLYPGPGECDTTDVSFSRDIISILSGNCYVCHSNLNAPSFGNGIRLEDYQDVVALSERITGSINHETGYSPMPKGRSKLDACTILKFEAWVADGSPGN